MWTSQTLLNLNLFLKLLISTAATFVYAILTIYGYYHVDKITIPMSCAHSGYLMLYMTTIIMNIYYSSSLTNEVKIQNKLLSVNFPPKGARVASAESIELSLIKSSWFEVSNSTEHNPNHTKIFSIKIGLKVLNILPVWLCWVGPNEWVENK